ncbi:MAG: hypothetical protein J6Y02_05290 [Pseudobutyrivibrio sp.]|nr:hypothetical protein [Pseudobutyrivibrio sp.]
MRKQVVKGLSLGLSAVTLAGSTSITAYADEIDEFKGEEQTQESQQEANEAEKAFAEQTESLNEDFNEQEFSGVGSEEDATGVAELTEIMADEIDSDDSPVAGETCTITVVDEYGQVVTDEETGDVVTEDVTFGEAADLAAAVTDDAAVDIENLNQAAQDLYTAAGEMDAAEANADAEVGAANQAASDAQVIAGEALAASNGALEAVENETMENAASIIATTQDTYDKAVIDFEKKEEAYNTAKQEYETYESEFQQKVNAYNNSLNSAYTNLEWAEEDLAAAQQRLADLQANLQKAYDEYLSSAAGVLATAEQTYQDSDKTDEDKKEYLKAILENYYFKAEEGQTVSVTEIGDFVDYEGTEKDLITVKYQIIDDATGTIVQEKSVNLGYDISGTQVDLYEKVTYYDYYDEDGNVAHITQEDIDTELAKPLAEQKIVKRYKKTVEVDGEEKTSYLVADVYDKLTDEEKADYTLDYIVLGNWDWDNAKVTGLDKTYTSYTDLDGNTVQNAVASEEIASDDEVIRVYSFDADGNYICTATNLSTKKVYTYVNNKLTATEYLKSNETAASIAAAKTGYQILDARDVFKASGYYVPRQALIVPYSVNRDVTWSGEVETRWAVIVPIPEFTPDPKPTSDDGVANGKADAAANAGNPYSNPYEYYGFSFDGFNDGWTAIEVAEKAPSNVLWVVNNGSVTYHVEGTYNISFDVVTDDTVHYTVGDAWNDFWTKVGNFLTGKDKETTKEAIIRQYEQEQHTKVVGVKSWNWDTKTAEFYVVKATNVNTTGSTYSAVEVGGNIDGNLSNLTYGRDINYIGKSTATSNDDYNKEASVDQAVTEKFFYNDGDSTFSNAASAYVEGLEQAGATMTKFFNLINLVNTAKEAVEDAQQQCEDIRAHIEDLNKTLALGDMEVLPELALWQGKLQEAEDTYQQAKEDLDDAKENLDKAKEDFKNKYSNDGTGEDGTEEGTGSDATGTEGTGTSTPGGVADGTPGTDYPAATFTITDPTIPLAGDTTANTTTQVANRNTRNTANNNAANANADADADADTADNQEVAPTPETAEDETIKRIADEATPLAVEEQSSSAKLGLWVSILLVIVVVAGSIAYYKKKLDAKNITKK